jgi:hypothetical protein
MCLLFHEWVITELVRSYQGEDWLGGKGKMHDIKLVCTDCKKAKYETVYQCEGHKSRMIELRSFLKKKESTGEVLGRC